MFEVALAGKKARWPGKLDVQHDLIFIEDAARAAILLGEDPSTYGRVWHVPGAGPLTGRSFLQMVYKEVGAKEKIGALDRKMVSIASLMSKEAREFRELLYQFETQLVLDGTKFKEHAPTFTFTPHDQAIKKTVEWFKEKKEVDS